MRKEWLQFDVGDQGIFDAWDARAFLKWHKVAMEGEWRASDEVELARLKDHQALSFARVVKAHFVQVKPDGFPDGPSGPLGFSEVWRKEGGGFFVRRGDQVEFRRRLDDVLSGAPRDDGCSDQGEFE